MTVGEKIRKLRKENKLTQKKLSELCGINEVQIRRYELGGRNSNPKIETLQKIATALNVPLKEFFATTDLKHGTVFDLTTLNSKELTTDILYQIIPELQDMYKSDIIAKEKAERFIQSEEINMLLKDYDLLNSTGKKEARKRISELTKISEYTKPDSPSVKK